jgi:hypothetical protein
MVLALPGLHDLTLNTNEAYTIRETLIRPADEMTSITGIKEKAVITWQLRGMSG